MSRKIILRSIIIGHSILIVILLIVCLLTVHGQQARGCGGASGAGAILLLFLAIGSLCGSVPAFYVAAHRSATNPALASNLARDFGAVAIYVGIVGLAMLPAFAVIFALYYCF